MTERRRREKNSPSQEDNRYAIGFVWFKGKKERRQREKKKKTVS